MGYCVLRHVDSDYQIRTLTVSPGAQKMSLRLEIRRLIAVDKWFLSVSNAVTGEPLVQYVPLVSSGDTREQLNNLLRQFGYKDMGEVYVLPKSYEYLGKDPAEGTLDRFSVVWSDGDG